MAATPEELAAAQALLDAEKEANKVTFDEAQQKKVTELIKAGKSEAAKELRAEHAALKAEHDALVAQFEAAKADLAKAKTPGGKKEAAGEVEALQAQIDEMKSITARANSEVERYKTAADTRAKEALDARDLVANFKRDLAIKDAAAKVNFFDPTDVAESVSKSVRWDEDKGRYIVVGDNGAVRMNAAFEDMSLDEYCQELATKKPYLVRGKVQGGSGSSTADRGTAAEKYELTDVFGPKSNGALANKLAMTEPAKYKQLKARALAQGIII